MFSNLCNIKLTTSFESVVLKHKHQQQNLGFHVVFVLFLINKVLVVL